MKRSAGNLLLLLFGTLVALLLAEAVCRIFLEEPQKVITRTKAAVAQPGEKQSLTIQQHPDEGGLYRGTPTGRRLKPNRIVTIENHRLSQQRVVIETNSIGYRNPEVGPKKNKRILFLGDSVTFQDYLNEEQTFVRLVEQEAARNGKEWQTINAGVGAISLKTEIAILLESGLALEPDVVVIGFYLNDFQDSKGVSIIHLPPLLENSWLAYHLVQVIQHWRGTNPVDEPVEKPDIASWLREYESRTSFAKGNFNESPGAFNTLIRSSFSDYGAAWSPASWDYMLPLFEMLKQLSIEHGFKLVIVGFPVYPQVYTDFVDDYPQQQLKRIGKDLDIPVFDLLPLLRTEALQRRDPSMYHSNEIFHDLFYDQCHHTPAGSAVIASGIYSFLDEQL